jgi:transposase
MKRVKLYARVRHAVRIEGISERAAAERFGINPRTVSKMLRFSVPPGYVRSKPPIRPKLDGFAGVIDAILVADKERPKKQQHTSKRVFERLRDEHGFTGKITIVKDYVAGWRQRTQEMFVPLMHPPGHAQVDFGEALGVIGGVEREIHFFAMDLPHSDAIFVIAYPAESTEAFCDGHVRAFAFFEGMPRSILYDNTKIAVEVVVMGFDAARAAVAAQRLGRDVSRRLELLACWLPKGITADMLVAAALPLTILASWAFMERPAPQQQGARRGKGEVKPYPLPRLGLESHLDKMRLRTSGECSRRNQMSERTVEPLAYDWAEAVLGSRT